MLATGGPFLFGVLLLAFVAMDFGEDTPKVWRIILVTLHILYWIGAIWWGQRGYDQIGQWLSELREHFAEVFARSDALYLILEHELPEQLQDKGPWYTQLTGAKPPADLRFTSRIKWFLGQYSAILSKLGLPSTPNGKIYVFSEYAVFLFWGFWLAESFFPDSVDSSLATTLVIHIVVWILVPILSVKTLASAAVANQVADILLGDVDLIGDESTG